jgi:hypothetical protein
MRYLPPRLRWLSLDGCNKITDEGLKLLPRTIKYLNLDDLDKITDEGGTTEDQHIMQKAKD